ncbi:MAG: DUF2911 domain-containing protein [Chitinophagales bacterium]
MLKQLTRPAMLFLYAAGCVLATQAQGVITTPRQSPAANLTQTIGISTVTVNYSRPSVQGREIWGALVPYGWNKQLNLGAKNDAPWRAGANENTVISFSHPVKVEGHEIPAGSYGLFFVINKDNTGEVVISKDYKSWGSFWYNPADDMMRAKIDLRTIPQTEWLTYDFVDLTKNSGELVLNWEKKQFPVKIEYATDEMVMANAKAELTNTVGFTPQGYASAANYAAQNKLDPHQALQWIDIALQNNPTFANMNTKSQILNEMGNDAEADKIMANAMSIANENDLNNYGYALLGNKDYKKAIDVLALNTQKHPNSANAWDSLGEAYALSGDKANAIANFKKSLSLNPPANVKANSEKYLKQLGAM